MQSLFTTIARAIGMTPNWKVRLARGDKVVVELFTGFRLGTIEGGYPFAVSMTKTGTGWEEHVRGYNSGAGSVIDHRGESAANPNEGTLSIFGAVFRFSPDGAVSYGELKTEVVGQLRLPK